MKKMKQIRVDDDLWRDAKAAAAKQGVTLEWWIGNALKTRLALDKSHSAVVMVSDFENTSTPGPVGTSR